MQNIYLARIKCYEDTQARVKTIPPPPKSIKLSSKDLPSIEHQNPRKKENKIRIQNMDSIECGLKYLRKGYNPVVMNLADDCWPGGCVDRGSGAQEESLFRCTNICETLTLATRFYPIHDDQLVYSPGVSVIKSSEEKGWKVFEPPFDKLSFISCPGIKYPKVVYPNPDATLQEARLQDEDEERLRVKIRLIMRCAALKGHDVIVMGALGCGAWKNPAPHVAQIFADVLAEPEFRGAFARIVFAIMKRVDDMYIVRSDKYKPPVDNYDVFRECFGLRP